MGNELVRTKTLVKNAIVVIDAAPFRQWYESHYALPLGRKKGAKLTDAEEAVINKKRSKKTDKKYMERQKESKVEQALGSVHDRSCSCFHLLKARTVRQIRRLCAGGQGAGVLPKEDQGQEGTIDQ